MIAEVPIIAVPAQKVAVILDNQDCVLRLYQRGAYLFCDLEADGVQAWQGFICQNRVNLKQYDYLPFRGGLYFVDHEAQEPPHFSGLGDRFALLFISADEPLPAGLRPRQGA